MRYFLRATIQVDMVLVPATTGDFGILPGHVPTVSQLRPGVVSVHTSDKDVKKYFVRAVSRLCTPILRRISAPLKLCLLNSLTVVR